MKIRRAALIGVAVCFIALVAVLGFFYAKYSRIADAKLAAGLIPKSSLLYAAPQTVGVGDPGTPLQFAGKLREAGYAEDARANATGWYHVRPDAIEIFPGSAAYTRGEPGVIRFANGKISSIISLSDNADRTEYTLEPVVISSLYDKNREKRRFIRYQDLPPVLIQALISAEDKRFFQHSGLDPIRVVKAAFDDVSRHRYFEGASTLTQQLARMLWLDNRKTISRKFAELMITIHLERKLTKEKILEYYCNQVDLGRRSSFAIRGFGEAAEAYFGKDVRRLSLPEAATLAGLIQEPSYRNPVRWPERAKARRNIVLRMMYDNGYIGKAAYEQATEAPMVTAKVGVESADAPYFVDLVNDRLADNFNDLDAQDSGAKIYTTLDLDLQHDATEAVAFGMKDLQAYLAKHHRKNQPLPDPQVALICIDPHTGEVKALIGGTNYAVSQFDHITAKRPPASTFKPFVYAAAMNTGLMNRPNPITPSTMVADTPQTFDFNGDQYSPVDYHKGNWKGDVTVREALAESLNVPAVELAQDVGYGAVADLAHKVGLDTVQATPAAALGTYDVTPLQMGTAYTTFANEGVMVQPRFISRILDKSGRSVFQSEPQTSDVIDPRVNFLVVSMMQQVLRSGTGAAVWSYGFNLPAAGKTGTEHDAWFAGFTSKLLCIVWVGQDNYQDLKVEGAHAALPIWAEFMKLAHQHRQYRDVNDFAVPSGIVSAQIDPESGALATSACPKTQTEYYILGTQPIVFCPLHQGGSTEIASWTNGTSPAPPSINAQSVGNGGAQPAYNPSLPPPPPGEQQQQQRQAAQKRGLFDRLRRIFK